MLSKKLNSYNKSESGFTLVELLIVIVIISILTGVLVMVINPVRQQNRSKNATIKSGISKLGFAINTSRSGTGTLPEETVLPNEIENITLESGCETAGELDCAFSLVGSPMPTTCGSGNITDITTGVGSSPCFYRVKSMSSVLTDGTFRLLAKKHKLDNTDPDTVYVFDSKEGLYECPALSAIDTAVKVGDITGCVRVDTGKSE